MDAYPGIERLIDAFSTHWIKYLLPSVIYVFLMFLSGFVFLLAAYSASVAPWLADGSFFVGLVLLLISHHWYFHKIFSEHMMAIFITSRRFVFLKNSMFFHDDMHEISLERILAVRAKKHGLIQNILDYGSFWFDTGGTTMENSPIIPQVPHPHQKVKSIMKLLQMREL
ncbi:MAG: PH domain-containing protein [Candidatus Peribacteraceae bacterium]|jgi:hypothetical protein